MADFRGRRRWPPKDRKLLFELTRSTFPVLSSTDVPSFLKVQRGAERFRGKIGADPMEYYCWSVTLRDARVSHKNNSALDFEVRPNAQDRSVPG